MPMVRPVSGLAAVVQNLATWRFNWGSPTVSGRFVLTRPSAMVATDPDISQSRLTRVFGRFPQQPRLKIEPEIRSLTTSYSAFPTNLARAC